MVSSANVNTLPLVIDSGRSFTKIENNLGPNLEPWETPYAIVLARTDILIIGQTAYVQTCNHQARRAGHLIHQMLLAFLVG